MAAGRSWQILLAIATVLFAGAVGVSHHRVCTDCLPGLPCYNYQWGTSSQTVTVVSLAFIPIEQRQAYQPGVVPAGVTVPTPAVVRERIKVFQLAQASVQNDHCFLSRVAVTLHENGLWTVSLRADQNPWMTGPRHEVSTPVQLMGAVSAVRPPIPELAKETDGLKRNQFWVKVRCYGAYPLAENVPNLAGGKPVLFELPTATFWVQRGIPYDFWAQQALPAVRQYFDLIDRVELEFSYR